jgi:hypothetical protein
MSEYISSSNEVIELASENIEIITDTQELFTLNEVSTKFKLHYVENCLRYGNLYYIVII